MILIPTTNSCYVSLDREPGVPAALETIHECGGNDWTCPDSVRLELELADAEDALYS